VDADLVQHLHRIWKRTTARAIRQWVDLKMDLSVRNCMLQLVGFESESALLEARFWKFALACWRCLSALGPMFADANDAC